MKNSTGSQIRKYVAGGLLSIAAVFGGALGSAGVSYAAPADGWEPIAPAAPVAPADGWEPIAPAAPVAPAHQVDAPVGPSSKAPARQAPVMNAPVHKAPASSAHVGRNGNAKGEGHSAKGRSH